MKPINATELMAKLNEGTVQFAFKKLDGNLRTAVGTTSLKYIPLDNHPSGEGTTSDVSVRYFDLGKNEWRSVSSSTEIFLTDYNMYEEIYNLCAVKNEGTVYSNGYDKITPRVQWILDLLTDNDMPFELKQFPVKDGIGYNILLLGDSDKWVTCHHDIVNPKSDNANDNSCSVINAIALKQLAPHINVAILDGEELKGLGSENLSQQMIAGDYGVVDWILNLELTGLGGKEFFIGSSGIDGKLGELICSQFECDILNVPFNDSVVFRKYGFDSLVINPLPRKEDGKLDTEVLFRCHSMEDSVDKISTEDMKIFTEEVLLPLVS